MMEDVRFTRLCEPIKKLINLQFLDVSFNYLGVISLHLIGRLNAKEIRKVNAFRAIRDLDYKLKLFETLSKG